MCEGPFEQKQHAMLACSGCIDDHWNVDGNRTLLEDWIGHARVQFLIKQPPEGQTWVNGTLTKAQDTTRLD